MHSYALAFPSQGTVRSPIGPCLFPRGVPLYIGALYTPLLFVMFLCCLVALSRVSIQFVRWESLGGIPYPRGRSIPSLYDTTVSRNSRPSVGTLDI